MPKVISDVLKDLRKRAKKLGIEFDNGSTEAELQVLVNAGEAAVKAREEEAAKTGAVAPGSVEDPLPKNPEPSVGNVAHAAGEAKPEGTGQEELMATVKVKNGHVFNLVVSPDGDVQVKKLPNIFVQSFGPVSSKDSMENAKKYMENLSRF